MAYDDSSRSQQRRPARTRQNSGPQGRHGARSSRQPSRRIPTSAGGASAHQRLRNRDTGLNLGQRPRTIRIGNTRYDARRLGMLVAAIVVLILLLVLISSCVRGCSKTETVQATTEAATKEVIASNISADMTKKLQARLDQDKQMEKIASQADQYADDSIIQLALDEPLAIDFVANLPSANKSASSYTDALTKGTVPQLYNWDTRWGYVSYAGLPLGVSGSGPTSLAMAYMGLTGKNDKSPADMASLASNAGYATGDAYTSKDFFSKQAASLGLTCEIVSPSSDEITGSLKNAHPVICLVAADTLTAAEHYVVCASVNEDGTVNVYDPTSSSVTGRAWSPSVIALATSDMFVMHEADTTSSAAASTQAAQTSSASESSSKSTKDSASTSSSDATTTSTSSKSTSEATTTSN